MKPRVFSMRLKNFVLSATMSKWCLVWGNVPMSPREVLVIYYPKWMVYDRYGSLLDGSRTSEPGGTPAAVAAVSCCGSVLPESDRPRREGPVPNTEWEARGDPRLGSEELQLTSDALAYYEKVHDLRREHADEARAEAGECEFNLGSNLRVTWAQAQRADKTLALMFGGKPLADGYRVAPDGLLERHVKLPPPVSFVWVPIVPEGQATGNLS